MNCSQAKDRIAAYVDRELAPVEEAILEQHFGECASCRRQHSLQSFLHVETRRRATYHTAPAALRRRIRRELDTASASGSSPWWQRWRVAIPMPAAAAAFVVMLAGNVYLASSGPSAEERIAEEVVTSHVRALVSDRPFDVASSDRHTVKPWYAGKLDFAPPVSDFAPEGFALVGGRLDYVDGRAVAALVYRHGGHLVDLFVWPDAGRGDQRGATHVQRGYNVRHWVANGMTYWAASDLDRGETDKLERLVAGRDDAR